MPVVAVGAAIFAGSGIAAAGGIAAFAAASGTFATIAAVGAIAAGIGVVTGNKALTKIGAVAGLVGGIGAFAQGQGWLAGDLAKGADAGGLAGAEAAGSDYGAGSAAEASAINSALAAPAPGVVDPSAGLVGSVDPSAANYTNAMDMASDAAAGSSAAGVAGEAGGLMNSAGPTGSGLNSVNGSDLMSDLYKGPGAGGFGATSTSNSIFGTLGKVGDFMEKNKKLTSMGLDFVGGMFDDKKAAEGDYIQSGTDFNIARTANANAQTEIMRQQMANANAVPDLTGLKVNPAVKVFNTGAPPVYMAPRAGLINSTGR